MRLPAHRQERTQDGTDLVAVDWPGATFTEIRVVLPLVRHSRREAALTQLLGRLLPLGPEDRNLAGHDERVLRRGGSITGGTAVDRFHLTATVPSAQLDWALSELFGRLVRPDYTDEAVADVFRAEATRFAQVAGHREVLLQPSLARLRWGADHPYARTVHSTDDFTGVLAEAPEAAEMCRVAADVLTLDGATVVVVGDLGTDRGRHWDVVWPRLAEPVTRASRTLCRSAARPDDHEAAPQGGTRTVLRLPSDEPIASLRLGSPAPVRQHPDHPALQQLSMCLSGYFGSRLNQELRERRGDVYGVTGGFEVLADAATLVVSLECPADRIEAVRGIVTETVDELCRRGPEAEELKAAVRYSTNAVTVGLSTPSALAGAAASVVFGGETLGMWERHADAAADLQPAEVAAAGRRYLGSERRVEVVARPS
ncbi:Predicted Zn-dependent peptidase [Actinopolyspora xinjiangensis]|uniref:Predicted Zn-dependent peptidase n=1 Tax=Actinopolyspora xinjiangensis TaxID=405564 RepID=A0A1H0V908_9ACTN|nr:insulinase family protein [Actinopolyspora xinjiangensis]SDP74715.1 Predicted Zn-dependent peptidase [Actinopolyspora xinjiangensis]